MPKAQSPNVAARPAMSLKWQLAILLAAAIVVSLLAFALLIGEMWYRQAGPFADATMTEPGLPLPPFDLIDENEQPLTLESLRGRPWVAAFGFTTCRGICPAMAHGYRDLQERMVGDTDFDGVLLVWFTVDPDTDTPEKLRAYGRLEGADPDRWRFATGAQEALWTLSEQGFQLMVEEDPDNQAMPFLHSSRFVLVDDQGMIRGYYNGVVIEERTALLEDLRRLAGRR